jgi:transcriptional regulator with XRE-family HTH domain
VTVTASASASAPVGVLLRRWRTHRRVSQLELALAADVSSRHLSFVETGRSQPSRDLLLRLCESLDVPARDRNELLLAAGLAPAYPSDSVDAASLGSAMAAVRELLTAHEPFPALVVDRGWDVVETNRSVAVLMEAVAPHLLEPPVNALRLTLHPDGLAPRILNLPRWRTAVLRTLRRDAEARADVELLALHDELLGYPGGEVPVEELAGSLYVPLVVAASDPAAGRDGVLSFLSFVSTLGTAVDVTLSELVVETFLPADPETAASCRAAAGG